MCHQVTCNAEFTFTNIFSLTPFSIFFVSKQYSFYSSKLTLSKGGSTHRLCGCVLWKWWTFPMSGIMGYPLQSQCTVLFFRICAHEKIHLFLDGCLYCVSAFPENTRASGKSSDVFLNVSDLPLRSSKIISRKCGCKPERCLSCFPFLPTALCCVSWYPPSSPSLASSIGAGCCWEYWPDMKKQMCT